MADKKYPDDFKMNPLRKSNSRENEQY